MNARYVLALMVVFVLLCVAALGAETDTQPAEPKSPAVREATARYTSARKAAEMEYLRAMGVARGAYVADLDNAFRVALRAENLDEANAIRDLKAKVVAAEPVIPTVAELVAELKAAVAATAPASPTAATMAPKVVVRRPIATTRVIVTPKEWKAAAQVKKGDTLELEAQGEWLINPITRDRFFTPEGQEGGRGALMAKINELPYRVGVAKTIEVPEDGVLSLGTNEPNPTNRGEIVVTIRIFRGGSK